MREICRNILLLSFALVFVCSSTAIAYRIDIDLNDFYLESNIGTDTISADGSEVTLYGEDILENDPTLGLGDPGIVVPANLLTLNFTYNFSAYSGDEFYAGLFDGDTGHEIDEWYIYESASGAFSFDLSTLDSSVTLLGLEFGISPNGDIGTPSVVVSDVYLHTAAAPVPEPTTMLLFGIGLLGLSGINRKKK